MTLKDVLELAEGDGDATILRGADKAPEFF